MDQKPAMYDYIQERIAEKRQQKKFLNILSVEEQEAIRQLNDKEMKEAHAIKLKAMTVGSETAQPK